MNYLAQNLKSHLEYGYYIVQMDPENPENNPTFKRRCYLVHSKQAAEQFTYDYLSGCGFEISFEDTFILDDVVPIEYRTKDSDFIPIKNLTKDELFEKSRRDPEDYIVEYIFLAKYRHEDREDFNLTIMIKRMPELSLTEPTLISIE